MKADNFSSRISELVADSNKSMTVIANELGVAKQTVSAWCTGRRKPKGITLSYLANYFKTSILWLNGLSNEKHPDNYEYLNKKTNEFVLMRAGRDPETGEKYSIKVELVFKDNKPFISLNGEIGDFAEVYSILSRSDKRAVLTKMLTFLEE